MGTFSVSIEVGDPTGQRWERIEAAVDTGASYTVVPLEMLRRLGVAPTGQRTFRMADERRLRLDIGNAPVRMDGEVQPTVVVFGDDPHTALLSAHTLEAFGLGVDPLHKRLIPVEAWLL